MASIPRDYPAAAPAESGRGRTPTGEGARTIATHGPITGRGHPRRVDPVIEVNELTKRYGGRTAVDRLSFTVRPGQVTGFLGPNGAGKTTPTSDPRPGRAHPRHRHRQRRSLPQPHTRPAARRCPHRRRPGHQRFHLADAATDLLAERPPVRRRKPRDAGHGMEAPGPELGTGSPFARLQRHRPGLVGRVRDLAADRGRTRHRSSCGTATRERARHPRHQYKTAPTSTGRAPEAGGRINVPQSGARSPCARPVARTGWTSVG